MKICDNCLRQYEYDSVLASRIRPTSLGKCECCRQAVEVSELDVNGLRQKLKVCYVPPHAKGDLGHRDCEMGFIYKALSGKDFWVLFWKVDGQGGLVLNQTPARCAIEDLHFYAMAYHVSWEIAV